MNSVAVCDVGLRWTGDKRAGSVKVVTALWLAGTISGCSACGESVGARLHRECESIVDTAGRVSSPLLFSTYDIIDVLAKDPKVRPELGNAYYDQWQKYRAESAPAVPFTRVRHFSSADIFGSCERPDLAGRA